MTAEEAARTRCSSDAVSGDMGRARAAAAPTGVAAAGASAGAAAEAGQGGGVSCGGGGGAPRAPGVAGWGTVAMGDGLQGSSRLHGGLEEACTEPQQPGRDAQSLTLWPGWGAVFQLAQLGPQSHAARTDAIM